MPSLTLLSHLWSLAVEEQFYLIWPPLLVLVLRRVQNLRIVLGICIVGAAASVLETSALWLSPPNHLVNYSRIYFGTDTCAQGLFMGAGSAVLLRMGIYGNPIARRQIRHASLLGLVACLVTWIVLTKRSAYDTLFGYGFFGASLAAVAALVLRCATDPQSMLVRILAFLPIRWIGVVSYGVNLWMAPVLMLMHAYAPGVPAGLRFAVAVPLILGVAAASRMVVERPALRLKHRFERVAAF